MTQYLNVEAKRHDIARDLKKYREKVDDHSAQKTDTLPTGTRQVTSKDLIVTQGRGAGQRCGGDWRGQRPSAHGVMLAGPTLRSPQSNPVGSVGYRG